jgi:protoheme IX farnesyltransferase
VTRRDLLLLSRPRIGGLAAAGTAAGFLAVAGRAETALWPGLALAACGALLLAAGCSALNQVQERREDARMDRTRKRPLASGRMSPLAGLWLAAGLLSAAALCLALTPGGPACALFAPLTVLVYNGLYTPLKKRTPLAMLVGAVAGALPPVVGCVAAGAGPLDPRCLLLWGIFYAWQAPHFWLFARMHRAEYEAAGFRVPQHGVGESRAGGTLAVWLASYASLLLLAPAFGLVAATAAKWLVAAVAASLCVILLARRERLRFALVNASLALFLCLLAADALRLAA